MFCPYYGEKECGKECIVQDQVRNMGYLCTWAVLDEKDSKKE